jgi:hypothetical protein
MAISLPKSHANAVPSRILIERNFAVSQLPANARMGVKNYRSWERGVKQVRPGELVHPSNCQGKVELG